MLTNLSALQSITISGAGMLAGIIFVVLAAAVWLFTRLFVLRGHKNDGNAESIQDSAREQDYAIVLAVMSDCLNIAGEQYIITSIKKVDS